MSTINANVFGMLGWMSRSESQPDRRQLRPLAATRAPSRARTLRGALAALWLSMWVGQAKAMNVAPAPGRGTEVLPPVCMRKPLASEHEGQLYGQLDEPVPAWPHQACVLSGVAIHTSLLTTGN